LAKVDGKFEKSEQKLLHLFLKEKGLEETMLEEEEQPMRLTDFAHSDSKTELLYWALRVMHADGVLHAKEILFCENLAEKLGYQREIISCYVQGPMPPFEEFEKDLRNFWSTR
jgi:tellurite resistance protein